MISGWDSLPQDVLPWGFFEDVFFVQLVCLIGFLSWNKSSKQVLKDLLYALKVM